MDARARSEPNRNTGGGDTGAGEVGPRAILLEGEGASAGNGKRRKAERKARKRAAKREKREKSAAKRVAPEARGKTARRKEMAQRGEAAPLSDDWHAYHREQSGDVSAEDAGMRARALRVMLRDGNKKDRERARGLLASLIASLHRQNEPLGDEVFQAVIEALKAVTPDGEPVPYAPVRIEVDGLARQDADALRNIRIEPERAFARKVAHDMDAMRRTLGRIERLLGELGEYRKKTKVSKKRRKEMEQLLAKLKKRRKRTEKRLAKLETRYGPALDLLHGPAPGDRDAYRRLLMLVARGEERTPEGLAQKAAISRSKVGRLTALPTWPRDLALATSLAGDVEPRAT